MKPKGIPSPILDDWIGTNWANGIRAFLTPSGDHTKPYGLFWSCDSSYLGSSISSLWAVLVCMIAVGAGLTFQPRRRIALGMLTAGALISALDTGFRALSRLDFYVGQNAFDELRDTMLSHLPNQILANLLLQFALPFAAGWVVARIMASPTPPDPAAELDEHQAR